MIRVWGSDYNEVNPRVYLKVDGYRILQMDPTDRNIRIVEALAEGEKLVVQSRSERGFWSNTDGWVLGMVDAEVYDVEEAIDLTQRGHLPLSSANDTEWVVVEFTY